MMVVMKGLDGTAGQNGTQVWPTSLPGSLLFPPPRGGKSRDPGNEV